MTNVETLDTINAAFETVGAVMVYRNVVALAKAQGVMGVSLVAQAFFTLWGGWNIAYYYGLGQHLSLAAQIAMFSGHCTWLGLALYFGSRK